MNKWKQRVHWRNTNDNKASENNIYEKRILRQWPQIKFKDQADPLNDISENIGDISAMAYRSRLKIEWTDRKRIWKSSHQCSANIWYMWWEEKNTTYWNS